MEPRDPGEAFRSSTPLELFFDLCFVVAVAQASGELHHAWTDAHFAGSIASYLSVFFAIWWAWMNFTWFASAYDTGGTSYTIAVFVQIAGALIIAAGVPDAFEHHDFTIIVLGYVVVRMALVSLWLRVAFSHEPSRDMALRFAIGVTACQIGWVMLALLTDGFQWGWFFALVFVELSVPVWAERHGQSAWHPRHIAERYGLFTLIVIGESVLSATVALQVGFNAGDKAGDLVDIALGGFLIICAVWMIYFAQPTEEVAAHARDAFQAGSLEAFVWGYGHLFIYASAAAIGAGLAVAVDEATGHARLSETQAELCVAIPVALFVLAVWWLHRSAKEPGWFRDWAAPVAAVAALVSVLFVNAVLVIGVLMWALVIAGVVVVRRGETEAELSS